MTMHDNLYVLLRHAWVFSVDPRRDLFLRTCFVRTELCGFAADEWDCPQQSVYHVHQNVHHVLQWPATILKTKQHTSEKGFAVISNLTSLFETAPLSQPRRLIAMCCTMPCSRFVVHCRIW